MVILCISSRLHDHQDVNTGMNLISLAWRDFRKSGQAQISDSSTVNGRERWFRVVDEKTDPDWMLILAIDEIITSKKLKGFMVVFSAYRPDVSRWGEEQFLSHEKLHNQGAGGSRRCSKPCRMEA